MPPHLTSWLLLTLFSNSVELDLHSPFKWFGSPRLSRPPQPH